MWWTFLKVFDIFYFRVANIKRHTLPDIGEGDEGILDCDVCVCVCDLCFIFPEGDFFRIKASRCSINKKSKHNT